MTIQCHIVTKLSPREVKCILGSDELIVAAAPEPADPSHTEEAASAVPEPEDELDAAAWGVLTPTKSAAAPWSFPGAAVKHALVQQVVTIGRDSSCTVVVPDPRVSGVHCRIKVLGCEAFLENTSQTNDTYINGASIGRQSLRQLHGDEVISVSDVIWAVHSLTVDYW